MRSFWAGVLGLLVLAPAGAEEGGDQTRLHCERLLDVTAGRVVEHRQLVIVDGRIEAVEDGAPEAADHVLTAPLTCLPGLIDLHTHLSNQYNKDSYRERFELNPGDLAFRMVGYAERTLQAGFTTVRDLGDRYRLSIALRDAINAGQLPGPRIFTAGKSIATTGGHADPTSGWRFDLRGDPGPKEGVINGVAEARKAVRQRYKDGSDLIKITATGGVLSTAASGQNAQFHADELAAIVATAKDYGFHVAAHAHGAEGMQRAIRAGVRSIEHGTFMDDETIALMKEHGTWYVPTIIAGKWVAQQAEIDGFFPDIVRPKAREVGPQIEKTFTRAYQAGVKIAFGTDSGVSEHGDNAWEFIYMVSAGMPPLEALRAATLNAAEVLDRRDSLGSLEAGRWADVVAVSGNPLADITVMRDVKFVMKAGKVYRDAADDEAPVAAAESPGGESEAAAEPAAAEESSPEP